MPVPYKHEKLASVSTIRLIKLKQEKIDGKIACTIRHVEQTAKDTIYDALSYVWGDPAPTRTICIKNTRTSEWDEFEVHENLWKFLNHVWEGHVFGRWFWTDRICLDQSHGSEELGEQIPRMAEIYRNAARVVAWLGMSDSQVRALIPAHNALQDPLLLDSNHYEGRLGEEYIAENLPKETAAAIIAVRDSEYWQRIWMVQELMSAKQIVVMIGDLEFTWAQIHGMMILSDKPENDGVEILRRARNMADSSTNTDLWGWLSQITSQDFKSTKPHDLVYGILGLAITYGSGRSQPNLIRKACYEEPHAYVIIDALFESFPKFGNSDPMVLLLQKSSIPNSAVFTTFKGYINSDRTSDRYKRLACIFLQTCDAFLSVLSPVKPELNWSFHDNAWHKIMWMTFVGVDTAEYAQHNAVLLGLSLVFRISVRGEEKMRQLVQDWKDIRDIGSKARGWWKCRNHLPYLPRNCSNAHHSCEGEEHYWYREDGPVYPTRDIVFGHASVSLPNLDPNLKQACSSREDFVSHLACHESIVGFQIPEAGFRVELDTLQDDFSGGLAGKRVSVWFWSPEDDSDGTDGVHTDQ